MAKVAFVLGGVCLMVLGTMAGPGVRLAPKISITPAVEGAQSLLPAVNGARSCGGHGEFLQLRYETCEGEGTCKVPGDGQLRKSELEFVPSQDISALGIRFLVLYDGEVVKSYERAISDSEVQGGTKYWAHSLGGASEELKGKSVTIQYILYRVDDNDVEVCSEADFEIV